MTTNSLVSLAAVACRRSYPRRNSPTAAGPSSASSTCGRVLWVGIAALGVVTIRAVVERRQQIGVLRAIGFQRGMVQAVFPLENLFVSGLGTFIGYALALTFAYNLYLQVAADQGLAFLPPWPTLIGIGIAVFAAVLFTAWLHARQSARVIIAEALRYQG